MIFLLRLSITLLFVLETFFCSKTTKEIVEKGVEYAQSKQ